MSNSFGKRFILSTFGESHGAAVGGTIDGMLPGVEVDFDFIQSELNRRRPGQSAVSTPRSEADKVKILSGIYEGKTTGTPIGFVVENTNQHSADYDSMADIFRPSHADYTYQQKYGIRDHRGGGRSSARETIARVVGGAFAKLMLRKYGIEIQAFTRQIGGVALSTPYTELEIERAEDNIVRCPDQDVAAQMIKEIEAAKADGDSVGGVVTCVIKGVPVGLGEPCFDKLQALLAHAMLSIGAVKGFEYGSGFAGVAMRGSVHNDVFYTENQRVRTLTNHSGGIQGGISNGEDIYFNVAFKPTATILREQKTINKEFEAVSFKAQGRHDPCVVPRAVPIVEAMAAMVIADSVLSAKC